MQRSFVGRPSRCEGLHFIGMTFFGGHHQSGLGGLASTADLRGEKTLQNGHIPPYVLVCPSQARSIGSPHPRQAQKWSSASGVRRHDEFLVISVGAVISFSPRRRLIWCWVVRRSAKGLCRSGGDMGKRLLPIFISVSFAFARVSKSLRRGAPGCSSGLVWRVNSLRLYTSAGRAAPRRSRSQASRYCSKWAPSDLFAPSG
jgi:hypothetical protein